MTKRTFTTPANLMGGVTDFFKERASLLGDEFESVTIVSANVTAAGTIVTYTAARSWGQQTRVAAFGSDGHCKFDMILE